MFSATRLSPSFQLKFFCFFNSCVYHISFIESVSTIINGKFSFVTSLPSLARFFKMIHYMNKGEFPIYDSGNKFNECDVIDTWIKEAKKFQLKGRRKTSRREQSLTRNIYIYMYVCIKGKTNYFFFHHFFGNTMSAAINLFSVWQ